MRCIQNNIAIYTPHSALDGAQGGINDFLATGFGAGSAARLKPTPAEGHPYAGEGVLLTLDQPISNVDFVNRVKSLLGLQTGATTQSRFCLRDIVPSRLTESVASHVCCGRQVHPDDCYLCWVR